MPTKKANSEYRKKLLAEYNKEKRKANRKLETFFFAERERSPAYKKLKTMVGAPYLLTESQVKREKRGHRYYKFRTLPKNAGINTIRESIKAARKFSEYKTSTSSGAKRERKKRIDKIAENYGVSRVTAEEFLEFLGTKDVAEQKKIYDSDVVLTALSKAYNKYGKTEMMREFQEFKNSGKTYADWIYLLDKNQVPFMAVSDNDSDKT